ncbi:MAG: twin-arginine translocase subunit TatC [Thermodesulfobacteriota bacterium]
MKCRLTGFFLELHKRIKLLGAVVAAGTLGLYFLSPRLFIILQDYLHQDLSFFTVAEPFLAHVKLALGTCLIIIMPWIIFTIWRALSQPFGIDKKVLSRYVFYTCLLFYTGTVFCYLVTLPFGINFLLGFKSEQLQPIISIDRFVTFVAMFIIAFGLIFELPVFMVFSSKSGLISRKSFEKNRRYAILVIAITAALLTPTPDVVNMALMGVPLYLLYEIGIMVLKIGSR